MTREGNKGTMKWFESDVEMEREAKQRLAVWDTGYESTFMQDIGGTFENSRKRNRIRSTGNRDLSGGGSHRTQKNRGTNIILQDEYVKIRVEAEWGGTMEAVREWSRWETWRLSTCVS